MYKLFNFPSKNWDMRFWKIMCFADGVRTAIVCRQMAFPIILFIGVLLWTFVFVLETIHTKKIFPATYGEIITNYFLEITPFNVNMHLDSHVISVLFLVNININLMDEISKSTFSDRTDFQCQSCLHSVLLVWYTL